MPQTAYGIVLEIISLPWRPDTYKLRNIEADECMAYPLLLEYRPTRPASP